MTTSITREAARAYYMDAFDSFAIDFDEADQPMIDAINDHLAQSGTHQTLVVDRIDDGTGIKTYVQCFQTYDHWSTEDAQAAFDTGWPENEASVEVATAPTGCRCGCGLPTSKNRDYRPGHDARHAGDVARMVLAGEVNINQVDDLLSPALATKAANMVVRHQVKAEAKAKGTTTKATGKAKAAVAVDPVKVGRWSYPARKAANGTVERNTKRDGSGEWVAA